MPPPYKGKGKAPMRDNDNNNTNNNDNERDPERDDSHGHQTHPPTTRQLSPSHHRFYVDHPPVLPSSINIRDFAYEGPVEQAELSHVWTPEVVPRAYLASTLTAGGDGDEEGGDGRRGDERLAGVPCTDDTATPGSAEASQDPYSSLPEGLTSPTAVARAAMNDIFDDEAPFCPTVMGRTAYTGSLDLLDSSLNAWGWDSVDVPEGPAVTFTAGRAQDHAVDEDRASSPAPSPPPTLNLAPVDLVQDGDGDQDRAPSPATSAPIRDIVPLDPYEFPFDSLPLPLPNTPEDVPAPSRCSNQQDHPADRERIVPSTARVLGYMSSLGNRSGGELRDGEMSPLSPRRRPVGDTTVASSRVLGGVVRASRIHRYTQTALSVDNEPSPQSQQPIDPLSNANAWIPEGVPGPSTLPRPPTPQRSPQRYSDIDTLMQSRNDSGQGSEAANADDAATQQVILHSLQTTAIVVNPAAREGEYGSDALENCTLPSSSEESGDGSSESSEGLMMPPYRRPAVAPYQVLRRTLSATPTPFVSPHLSPRASPQRPPSPDTGGSPAQGGDVRLRSLARLRSPSPDLPRRQSLQAEQRALERLRIYASMEDPTAQELLTAYERRLVDWQYGNTIELHGIFLTRRADSTRLPHGYMPRFARWALELVESGRATWDLFLLSVDDERHFVLPHSTHAPEVSERPVLVDHLRTTSVPPTSRNHADVEVPERARSTSPEFTQVEGQVNETVSEEQSSLQPRVGTPLPDLAAAFTSALRPTTSDPLSPMENPSPDPVAASIPSQNTEQPTTHPADQELASEQVSSSRNTRDSVVSTSTSADRAQSHLLTLIDPPISVPTEEQYNSQPPMEVQMFATVVYAFMYDLDPRQPAAQPVGQESESPQAGSGRDARDSIVRTSVGTGEKGGGLETVGGEREEGAV